MNLRLAQTTVAFVAMASLIPSAKAADKRSPPPLVFSGRQGV